jgi:hypothetical protein
VRFDGRGASGDQQRVSGSAGDLGGRDHDESRTQTIARRGGTPRRYLVCRNRQQAVRQRQPRAQLLAELRQELARLDPEAPAHTKRACELVASPRDGRYLSRGLGGRLAIDAEAIRRAERMDGKYVLLTNDDTLTPEDVGLGYKAMAIIETCFRRLKTTGLRIRPVYHWTAHRMSATSSSPCWPCFSRGRRRSARGTPGGICVWP